MKKTNRISPDKFAQYEKLVATNSKLELKGVTVEKLKPYFDQSFEYVNSLKPKATKK
jgi:hypothetical protein